MRGLDLARRLLLASSLLLLGGVAISVLTRDEWLAVAHAAGVVSAVVAACAVLLLLAAGLRRIGMTLRPRPPAEGLTSHERGQVGLD